MKRRLILTACLTLTGTATAIAADLSREWTQLHEPIYDCSTVQGSAGLTVCEDPLPSRIDLESTPPHHTSPENSQLIPSVCHDAVCPPAEYGADALRDNGDAPEISPLIPSVGPDAIRAPVEYGSGVLVQQIVEVPSVPSISIVPGRLSSTACDSEQVADARPRVCISVFLLEETEACRPRGYASRKEGSNCEVWEIDEFLKYAEKKKLKPVYNLVPPQDISLDHLSEAIRRYSNRCSREDLKDFCTDPNNRKSVLLIIETDMQPGLLIGISRLRSDSSDIPPYRQMDMLQPSGRWLNHQRADAFLPKKNFTWRLQIGDRMWTLGTKNE